LSHADGSVADLEFLEGVSAYKNASQTSSEDQKKKKSSAF